MANKYRIVKGTEFLTNYDTREYFKIQKKFLWWWIDVHTPIGVNMGYRGKYLTAYVYYKKLKFKDFQECCKVLDDVQRKHNNLTFKNYVSRRYEEKVGKIMIVNHKARLGTYNGEGLYQMCYSGENIDELVESWRNRGKTTVVKSD